MNLCYEPSEVANGCRASSRSGYVIAGQRNTGGYILRLLWATRVGRYRDMIWQETSIYPANLLCASVLICRVVLEAISTNDAALAIDNRNRHHPSKDVAITNDKSVALRQRQSFAIGRTTPEATDRCRHRLAGILRNIGCSPSAELVISFAHNILRRRLSSRRLSGDFSRGI